MDTGTSDITINVTKTCTKCHETKSLNDFYGKATYCKECQKTYAKDRRKALSIIRNNLDKRTQKQILDDKIRYKEIMPKYRDIVAFSLLQRLPCKQFETIVNKILAGKVSVVK